ncbi:MAG: hypothetical protein ACJA1B_002537 [Polaribacter sp.]|jgi:hypothetical protein
MKHLFLFFFISLLFFNCDKNPKVQQEIIHTDITNFWKAYDHILAVNDTILQLKYLEEYFLDKATKGQQGMIRARNYTPKEYLNAMKIYPRFWNSIRNNTLNTAQFDLKIREGVENFKEIYPDLKPATIYYTMGVFRSPGTGFNDMALIGSEFALGDRYTVTEEFPKNLNYVKNYYKINPPAFLDFLNIHEYIHTQQNPALDNLVSQSLYEGIADFIAIQVTNKKPPFKYYKFGFDNEAKLKVAFENDLFNIRKMGDWMWNENNQFKTRDLIYFIGARIAEANYNKASDKKAAIKEMIELAYNNDTEIEEYVNNSGYFSTTLKNLQQKFEESRPTVTSIKQFKNGTQNVSSKLSEITLYFSETMDINIKSTGFGELGKNHFPKVISIDFAEDGLSITYNVNLEPNKRYQILLENSYRTENGNPLQPFLIDFKTKK